ncbi:MAG TPA: lyase family protein [Gemmataceae bacterium]|nr:lyase family protein [Gemmataceae bacterium]
MTVTRVEHDGLGPVSVPADKLWGAQTQRSLEHFGIGDDLIPREMMPAYAIVKKAAALVNHRAGRLGEAQSHLIVRVCDEITDDLERLEEALRGVYRLALGGTAVATGINAQPGFDRDVADQIARLTDLPFVTAPNKFTVQGVHNDLVQLSATLKTLAVSLFKIANDTRLLSSGPRAGIAEMKIPANEPGSFIMPGKVNPTQCEALAMIAAQVMANDMAVAIGGSGGYLEMNVCKPLLIFNITKSIRIMADGCTNFRRFLVEGAEPNLQQIGRFVEHPDAGHGAQPSHRLRQGVPGRALRPGSRPHALGGRAATRGRRRGGVRPDRRSPKDGPAARGGELNTVQAAGCTCRFQETPT